VKRADCSWRQSGQSIRNERIAKGCGTDCTKTWRGSAKWAASLCTRGSLRAIYETPSPEF